eukprot:365447-Chlamydomonas_euryale.AAC.16
MDMHKASMRTCFHAPEHNDYERLVQGWAARSRQLGSMLVRTKDVRDVVGGVQVSRQEQGHEVGAGMSLRRRA